MDPRDRSLRKEVERLNLMKGFGQEYKILVKFAHGRTVSVMTGKGTDGPVRRFLLAEFEFQWPTDENGDLDDASTPGPSGQDRYSPPLSGGAGI